MTDNLKWLLIVPVIIVAIGLGYLVPKLLSGGSDASTVRPPEENKALEVDIADTQQTVQGYMDILSRNPNDFEALRSLADKYRELGSIQSDNNKENDAYGSYKSAIDNYRKYLTLKPDDTEVRIDLGLTYGYLQMPEIAERELKTVTQQAPKNQRGWHSLGWIQANLLGKNDEAKVAWTKSYEIAPTSPIGLESKQFIDQALEAQQAQPATP